MQTIYSEDKASMDGMYVKNELEDTENSLTVFLQPNKDTIE